MKYEARRPEVAEYPAIASSSLSTKDSKSETFTKGKPMKKSESVIINGREIVVNELITSQIADIFESFDVDRRVTQAEILMDSNIPIEVVSAATGLGEGELNCEFAPSELAIIWAATAKVNDLLFNMLSELNDNIGSSPNKSAGECPVDLSVVMEKTGKVNLGNREIDVNELTVAQIGSVFRELDTDRGLTRAEILMDSNIPIEVISAATGLGEGELNCEFAPSELAIIWAATAKVNDLLFNVLSKLNDKIGSSPKEIAGDSPVDLSVV